MVRIQSPNRYRTILLLVIAVIAQSGCQEEAPVPASEPVVRPVRYERVSVTEGGRARVFSGIAVAGAEITMSFRIPGPIREVAVEVGDRIREGQLIGRLDTRDYELQVEDVEFALAQARAQARNARADLQRVQSLWENNNATTDDMDAALAAAESMEATVRSVEKRLELARLQLSYCELVSGTDGAVAEVRVDVNENVAAGQAIAVINAGASPEVEIAVPESLITQIRQGARATVRFDALPAETFQAVVTEVGVAPTRSATTFPARMRLEANDSRILAGMAAEAEFTIGSPVPVPRIVVPAEAVGEDTEGTFVYTLRPDSQGLATAERRGVTVGDLTANGLEILSGIQDGESVITAGVDRIDDGQTVRVEDGDR